MKIQLINSSKLKISFNKIDLDENNISIHSFLSRSQISQKFIKAIIEIANEDFGFDIKNNNFIYEIYCFNFADFIIIISKNEYTSYKESNQHVHLTYKTNGNNCSEHPSLKSTSKQLFKSKSIFLFFENFEDFLQFSFYLKTSLNFKNINSILYEYNNIYLLEIITSNLLENELNMLLYNLIEYKTSSPKSALTLTRFKEFAKILLPNNALNL